MAAVVNGNTPANSSSAASPVSSSQQQQQPDLSIKSSAAAGAKQPAKAMLTNARPDAPRKSSGAALSDATNQKRAPSQKAWTSGTNPITQRANMPSQQNGSISPAKPSPRTDDSDVNASAKGPSDHLLFLLANAIGQNAYVTTRAGESYTGVFFGASSDKTDLEYLLKMVQSTGKDEGPELNGIRANVADFVGAGDDHAMSFKAQEVSLKVDGLSLGTQERRTNGASAGFRTDTEISGNKAGQERELQKWVAPQGEELDQSLESSSTSGTWDQFKANESLYGVKSDYDENIYTTRIDRSHPNYRQREAEARKVAARMGESPGEVQEGEDWDEEDMFSGVRREASDYPPLRSTQPNRYQPPARRPPTGKPTVSGVPVDPAIISSQIARPEEASPTTKEGPNPSLHAVSAPTRGASAEANSTKDVAALKTKSAPNRRPTPPEEPGQDSPATKAQAPNAAANIETNTLNAFKSFREKEKTRVADDRRQRVLQDKTAKLNELRSFSKAFTLHTNVPKDLVPILAKDKKKQDEIIEKAAVQAEQAKVASKSPPSMKGSSPSKHDVDAKREAASKAPQSGPERATGAQQGQSRANATTVPLREKAAPPVYPVAPAGLNDHGLSQRLAKAQRDRQVGIPVQMPTPIPIHTAHPKSSSRSSTNAGRVPSSQGSSAIRTPTSATSGKFNAKAHEFVPNPAATSFMPGGQPSASSSPQAQGAKGRSASRITNAAEFFGDRKPLPANERPLIQDYFNPLKRLKEKAEKEGKTKDYAANGGIPHAYATPVTWTVQKDGEEGKSYKDMFGATHVPTGPSPRAAATSPVHHNLANQQVPPHLHPGTQASPNMHQQAMYQTSPQQHLYPGMPQQFDEHRMHGSPSLGAYPAPRMQHAYGGYAAPPGPPNQGAMPVGYPYPQPVHPQMVTPGMQQQPQFRQMSNTPQFMPSPGQQMAAPVMVQQGSQGPYMPQGTPMGHMPVYPAGAVQSFGGYQGGNYGTPVRAAPMMIHQGSYQGQQPPMHPSQQYGQGYYSPQPPQHGPMRGYSSPQPPFSQSPQQQNHYPPQPHRMGSRGYGPPSQAPPMSMQPGASEGSEGPK